MREPLQVLRMLSDDAAKIRIWAARLLRGLSQDQLDALGYADGLNKQELSRTERGELPLTRVRRETLARLLRFPIEWFTAEDIDDLIRWPAAGLPMDQIKRAAEALAPQLLEAARAIQQASDKQPRAPGGPGHPPAGAEGGSG